MGLVPGADSWPINVESDPESRLISNGVRLVPCAARAVASSRVLQWSSRASPIQVVWRPLHAGKELL
jgi:hypothetical protein